MGRAEEQLDAGLDMESSHVPIRRELSETARMAAGLVGQRSNVRGRALGVIMAALNMAGCMPPAHEAQQDKGTEVEAPLETNIDVMFMDSGVKLFGYAQKNTNFLVKLKGENGRVLLEESHDVQKGSYNLNIECEEIATARTVEVVQGGRTFVFENQNLGGMPEMPER